LLQHNGFLRLHRECRCVKAIAGDKHTEWRRIVGRLREAAVRASLLYAGTAATKKAGEKTSQAVCLLTEIA
jgi:hypothetical protein